MSGKLVPQHQVSSDMMTPYTVNLIVTSVGACTRK